MMDKRKFIARNVAALFCDGDVVNLGVGIPTLASSYISQDITVLIHAENGILGVDKSLGDPWRKHLYSREAMIEWLEARGGEKGNWRTIHRDLCDASLDAVTMIPGGSCFDSTMAFAIARGGRLSATVLGAFQVDQACNLASWKIPGKKLNGMGGAMDIASGAKKVIVAMEHCNKNGEPKIVKKCTLPLTAEGCVKMIVTDLCEIECSPRKMKVIAIAPGVTEEEIISKTDVELTFSKDIQVMLSID